MYMYEEEKQETDGYVERRHTQSKPVPINGVLLVVGCSLLRVTHGDRDVLQIMNTINQGLTQ